MGSRKLQPVMTTEPSPAPAPGVVTEPIRRRLYGPDEAAFALGVSKAQLYILIRQGRLLSVKIGKLRKVPVDAIETYLAQLTLEALG